MDRTRSISIRWVVGISAVGGLIVFALFVLGLMMSGCGPVPAPTPPHPAPGVPSWTITLTSEPTGAVITAVDGPTRDLCTTPCTVTLPQQGFTVRAHKDGFTDPAWQPVTLTANRTVAFTLTTAAPAVEAFSLSGRLALAGGKPYTWRAITAFELVELVAHGHVAEADAYLTKVGPTGLGFTLGRVLTMCAGLFQLTPAEGIAALDATLSLAERHGVRLEVVALADTKAYGFDQARARSHVAAVGAIVARHPGSVLEVANEFRNESQAAWLHDAAAVSALASSVPAGVVYTVAPDDASNDEDLTPGGMYVVRHMDRGRDRWNRERRASELAKVSAKLGRMVVSDEPIGAAELAVAGKRDDQPAAFYAQAALARGLGISATFHCDDCIRARPLRPVQLACAKAWIDGSHLWPDGASVTWWNARDGHSPVKEANFRVGTDGKPRPGGTVDRVFASTDGARWLLLEVGVVGDPGITWQNGFHAGAVVADRPGFRVVEAVR